MPPRQRPVNDRERKELVKRVLALPEGERLQAYADIRDYLAAELGEPDEVEEEILSRRRALADLRTAAELLWRKGELADERAPTAEQYRQVAEEMDLSTSKAALVRSFGLWRNAQTALLGGDVPEGPAGRRIRAKRAARRNQTVDQFDGMREWLKGKPSETDRADYDAFAVEANKQYEKNIYSSASSILVTLGIGWQDALEVARGEASLNQVRERRLADAIAGLTNEDFIGPGTAALILGVVSQRFQRVAEKEGFPVPVVDLPRLRDWVLGDIRAFAAGQDFPERKRGSVNSSLLLSKELAKKLGIDIDYLRTWLSLEDWTKAPKPDGKIGNANYWWRASAEERIREIKSARQAK